MPRGYPFICTRGHIFEVGHISGVREVSFTNATSRCPNCGSEARSIDGSLRFTEDSIEVLQGNPFLNEAISKLNRLSEKIRASSAQSDPISDDIIDALNDIAPGAGSIVKVYQKQGFTIAALLAFIWILCRQIESDVPPQTVHVDNSRHSTTINLSLDLGTRDYGADTDPFAGQQSETNVRGDEGERSRKSAEPNKASEQTHGSPTSQHRKPLSGLRSKLLGGVASSYR